MLVPSSQSNSSPLQNQHYHLNKYHCLKPGVPLQKTTLTARKAREKMSDWGPVFVAVMLFILLTPGLLIQVPGHQRFIEFGNFKTSGVSILVHSIVYFALSCIFLLAVGVHIAARDGYGRHKNRRKNYTDFIATKMVDWGPVLIGVVLFVVLTPGLLFQIPGNSKQVEFGSLKTNGMAIAVHTLIFFAVYSILILAAHVHIYTG
ncbi:hypothetical protein SADUNF_Sadunf17G0061200 [Salix dunnii]|uniref:Uncharacterized protein n=1 Tax=Salix dunnii TaxID=1413687 RepID=A0A835MN61_9ROSI|nr:hypothetical protein SADUNF_Sadunf17G0061200 [Salix dunnii]